MYLRVPQSTSKISDLSINEVFPTLSFGRLTWKPNNLHFCRQIIYKRWIFHFQVSLTEDNFLLDITKLRTTACRCLQLPRMLCQCLHTNNQPCNIDNIDLSIDEWWDIESSLHQKRSWWPKNSLKWLQLHGRIAKKCCVENLSWWCLDAADGWNQLVFTAAELALATLDVPYSSILLNHDISMKHCKPFLIDYR